MRGAKGKIANQGIVQTIIEGNGRGGYKSNSWVSLEGGHSKQAFGSLLFAS